MQSEFESRAFEDYHEALLPQQWAEHAPTLPLDYARTLKPFGIQIAETAAGVSYAIRDGRPEIVPGTDAAETLVELSHANWENLTHDLESASGLIYSQRVKRLRGDPMQFLQWEPALRRMYCGRPVYDPMAVDLRDSHGKPLDPTRSFQLDDDREEMAEFLRRVGYLWVRNVFSAEEIATLQAESERLRAAAREGDQESWWGKNADGDSVLCRVLRAGKEPRMRSLHDDPRLRRLADLCDVPMHQKQGPIDKDGVTLLWKQPGVEEGLGDLPWHRDCGMGGHASMCPTGVLSIFLGPNTPEAGELRFLPGSWEMSLPFIAPDSQTAPRGVAPPATAGDVTFHYGDGMHVAPPPTGTQGPFRSCVLIGYQRVGGGHHLGGRHYNDVLLGREDGQVEHMTKVASRF